MKFMNLLALIILLSSSVLAGPTGTNPDQIKKSTENEVSNLIDPILKKYCVDQCKLLSVEASVDLAAPDQVAPGFEEQVNGVVKLAPTSVRVRMLIDDMVGPATRTNIFNLVQEYIDVLPYPVTIETKVTRFPQPVSSAHKVAEMRNEIAKKFQTTISTLFQQFCPEQCLLGNLNVTIDPVNAEEAQYGTSGEFYQDGDTVVRIKKITGSLLLDETLTPVERNNVIELAMLKTNSFKHVELEPKVMKFPHPAAYGMGGSSGLAGYKGYRDLASSDSKSTSDSKYNQDSKSNSVENKNSESTNSNSESTNSDSNTNKQERFERYEKLERVENGDKVQTELKEVKLWGGIIAGLIIVLLAGIIFSILRPNSKLAFMQPAISKLVSTFSPNENEVTRTGMNSLAYAGGSEVNRERGTQIMRKYEIERIVDELTTIFAEQPKVAKQVFSRVLKEEGVEITANYISIFGEAIVIDMLRDPSLQRDVNELMEFYAKNQFDLTDEEKLDLLRQLHNRTVAAKLMVTGNRSSNLFDFLIEMDGLQILEMIRNESLTVKAIVMTQCDPQKRAAIFTQLDEATRMKLMTELSRIDHLPRDYIFNVANALRRKRQENPRLNTEALPGSEVLVGLLERTPIDNQRSVLSSLEHSNPDSARTVMSKLVSVDTLPYLRDNQLLEIVLNLKHDELIQFLKGTPKHIRDTVFAKSPKDLVGELEEELNHVSTYSREVYQNVERKILNRIKLMSNDGLINLMEVNERMFGQKNHNVESIAADSDGNSQSIKLKKVGGW